MYDAGMSVTKIKSRAQVNGYRPNIYYNVLVLLNIKCLLLSFPHFQNF